MSDRPSASELNAEPLRRALRELPPAAPADDAWPRLAASLAAAGLVREDAPPVAHRPQAVTPDRRARGGRRGALRWLGVALAASLALLAVALLPRQAAEHQPGAGVATTSPTAAGTAAATELTSLRSESSRIEEWLRTLKADETPLDGSRLMAATEIEDMIGLIDLQLAAGGDSDRETAALWQHRVELLRDLVAVRTIYSLAGTGVAANGNAAAPDNWTTL